MAGRTNSTPIIDTSNLEEAALERIESNHPIVLTPKLTIMSKEIEQKPSVILPNFPDKSIAF